jgi:hypothetical protein
MSTRIYLPSSGSAPITPSTWNMPYQAGTTYTLPGKVIKGTTAFTSRTTAGGTTSGRHYGVMRYVIGPLNAVQISGTINLVMRVSESNSNANATFAVAVKIIQPNGADRSVLLAYTASDNAASPREFTTSLENKRAFNVSEVRPIPLTARTPTQGDYLVIEIGFRYGSTTSYNIAIRHGDNSVNDLADADSGTNDYAPWIEFSQTLPFSEEHSGTAVISGSGSQVDSVLKGGMGSVLVSVTGTLLAIGVAGMLAIASISSGGSQIAIGKKTAVGSSYISGGGESISEGRKNSLHSIYISETGDLTSNGTKSIPGIIQTSGNGILQGIGSKQAHGSSSISGSGNIYAEGYRPESCSGVGIISGSGFIVLTGKKNAVGEMSIKIDHTTVVLTSDGKLSKRISSGFILKI